LGTLSVSKVVERKNCGGTGRGINPGQSQSVFYTEVPEDIGCDKGRRRHHKGLSAGA